MMRIFLLSCLIIVSIMQVQSYKLQAQSDTPEPSVTWTEDSAITAMVWSGDGQSLVVASGDLLNPTDKGIITLYSSTTQEHEILVDTALPINALAWRESDGAIFATHNEGFYFDVWDSATGEQIATAPEGGQGAGLALNPVDERLAVSYGGFLTLYDAALETSIEDAFYQTLAGAWIESHAVLWMPDGEHVITAGHPDAPDSISLWSPDGDNVLPFEASDELTANKFDLHLALSADGEWLAAATGWIYLQTYELTSPDVLIWSTEDGSLAYRFASDSEGILALAWSPDGEWLAMAGVDGTLTLWNIATETAEAEWMLSKTPLTALTWSSENQLAVGASSGDVLIFDMADIDME